MSTDGKFSVKKFVLKKPSVYMPRIFGLRLFCGFVLLRTAKINEIFKK